jgi:SAM-dependent methyltransferase
VSAAYATGEGPGDITPDGCAVELYSLLPPGREEAAVVASVTPAGGTVLELGAGAGRVTHCLVALGLHVVAVDESAEMLARIGGAETVQSSIEALDLGRTFDAVVLGSHLVNIPDDDAVRSLLLTCARHVAADGHVFVERRDPAWFDTAGDMQVERDGITYVVSDVSRPAADQVTATVSYTIVERTWSQTFTTRRVDDGQMAGLLSAVGLRIVGFLGPQETWAHARLS